MPNQTPAGPSGPPIVTVSTKRIPSHPPAVWAAFARQGAWKSWVLLLQFTLNFFLALAAIGFSRKEPDVVLVEPDGKSTYVNRSIAGDALARFLTEQRQQPSDVTVVHFTKEFLSRFLAVNSSTIDASWSEALAMMEAPLRARISKEASAQKLLETYRLAQVRTALAFEDILLVERLPMALHVRATVTRDKRGLADGGHPSTDKIVVDLIERVVPRTTSHPDGLEVAEYRNQIEIAPSRISSGDPHAP